MFVLVIVYNRLGAWINRQICHVLISKSLLGRIRWCVFEETFDALLSLFCHIDSSEGQGYMSDMHCRICPDKFFPQLVTCIGNYIDCGFADKWERSLF